MNISNQEVKLLWEAQKNGKWKTLTNPLTRDYEIHSQLDNLITTFYWKFRERKGVPQEIHNSEIDFQGFKEFEDFPGETKMGHCEFELNITFLQALDNKKIEGSETYKAKISISLSQKYLLNRLGMDEFITDYHENEKGRSWTTLSINFNELISTIAHELAHAYQNTIRVNNGEAVKSQCASSGDKENYPALVAEHTALTSEIKRMIENSSEYQEFKEWWNNKNSQTMKSKQNKENTVSSLSSSNPEFCQLCKKNKGEKENFYCFPHEPQKKYCFECMEKKKAVTSQQKLRNICQICQREIKESEFFGSAKELKTCQNCWQKEQVKTKQVNQQNNWQPWMTWTAVIGGGVLAGLIICKIIKAAKSKK